MLAEVRAGLYSQADGTISAARITRLGAIAKGDGQGRYYEQTARGNIFSMALATTSGSIVVGSVTGATAANLVTGSQFALWNPYGSGKNLSLLKFGVTLISGTAPVGPVFHSMAVGIPTIATTVATPIVCNNPGFGGSCVARGATAAAGVALTGSPNPLTIICMADLWFTAGTPGDLPGTKCIEYIDGNIVIAPGTMWVPTWASAAALLWAASITWEEIPV